MADFIERISVKINFDAQDVEQTVAKVQSALAGLNTADLQDSVDTANREIEALDDVDGDIDIKARVDEDQISRKVAEAASLTSAEIQTAEQLMAKLDIEADYDNLENLSKALLSTGISASRASGAVDLLRNSIDESTDSMSAATKVSELFEDGMGNLSINVGAFTIALRNFLTQVPAILGALSAIGAAAAGVAASFLTAGFAITAAFGAGAIAMLQDMEEDIAGINNMGEAMQELFSRLKAVFLEAFSPLIDNQDSIEIFTRLIESLARSLYLVADAVSDTTGTINSMLDMMSAELVDSFNNFIDASVFAFELLNDEFVLMIEFLLDGTAALLRFSAVFVDGFMESTELADSLVSTLSELAQVVQKIFQGAAPVLIAFTGVLRTVAEALNSLDTELFANLISFVILTVAVNKLAGFLAGLLSIVPSLSATFAVASATTGGLAAQMSVVYFEFLKFLKSNTILLGGLTALSERVSNLRNDMALLGASTKSTAFDFDLAAIKSVNLGNALGYLRGGISENISSIRGFQRVFDERLTRSLSTVSSRIMQLPILSNKHMSKFVSVFGNAARSIMTFMPAIGAHILMVATGPLAILVGALGPVGLAILAIAAVGTLLIGVLGNMQTVMSDVKTAVSALRDALVVVGKFLLKIFVATWNLVADAMQAVQILLDPITSLFKGASSEGGGLASILSVVADVAFLVADVFSFYLGIVGDVIKGVAVLGNILLQLLIAPLRLSIGVFKSVIGILGDLIFGLDGTANTMAKIGDFIDYLIDGFRDLRSNIAETAEFIIDSINDAIIKINNALGFALFEPIDLTSAARVSREDVISGAEAVQDEVAQRRAPNISLEEGDNITNVELQAEPEDRAKLSRTVERAIEQANSFERRRQGTQ